MKHFKRITVDANQLGGTPCIRGLRIPVSLIARLVSEGMTEPEILKAYPDLDFEDNREALRYAKENLVADLTEEQLDGIRQRVRSGIAAIDTGKFKGYEGLKGLRKLADRVKRTGRFPTKSR